MSRSSHEILGSGQFVGDHSCVEERRIPAPEGGDISVIDYGGDGPAVVLLHHLGMSPLQWRGVVDALGDRVHAVAPALRGHGRTSAPPLSGADNRHDLPVIVDSLGLERPVVVAAGSLCAAFALAAAIEHPDLFSSVVTINGTFPETRERAESEVDVVRSPEMIQYMRDRFGIDQVCPTHEALTAHLQAKQAALHQDWVIDKDVDLLSEILGGLRVVPDGMSTSPDTDTIRTLYDFAPEGFGYPDRELYRAVGVPVHVLHGLESWDERGVALEYEFSGVNPDVVVHLLEAGQFPMYSHPAEIAKHVLQAMALV